METVVTKRIKWAKKQQLIQKITSFFYSPNKREKITLVKNAFEVK